MSAEQIHLGTPLRDAAIEPRESDHLAPTNADLVEAGLIDPHGPHVVSPTDAHARPFEASEAGPHPSPNDEEACECMTCRQRRAALCGCLSCRRWRDLRAVRDATLGE